MQPLRPCPRAQQGAWAGAVPEGGGSWCLIFTFCKFHYQEFQV